jgi:hypothetical protein
VPPNSKPSHQSRPSGACAFVVYRIVCDGFLWRCKKIDYLSVFWWRTAHSARAPDWVCPCAAHVVLLGGALQSSNEPRSRDQCWALKPHQPPKLVWAKESWQSSGGLVAIELGAHMAWRMSLLWPPCGRRAPSPRAGWLRHSLLNYSLRLARLARRGQRVTGNLPFQGGIPQSATILSL